MKLLVEVFCVSCSTGQISFVGIFDNHQYINVFNIALKSVFCLLVITVSPAIAFNISVHKTLFSSTFSLSFIASNLLTKSR
ncbi:MAG: hypothetical protein Q8S84_08910 [bacterium]|nr:hypothetical protein [bacterium]MDP3381547.1 hypothetical protein [bacterium]